MHFVKSPRMESFSNCCKDGLKSDCQFCNKFLSECTSKTLANVEPKGRFHRCRTGQSEVNFLLKYMCHI